MICEIGKILLAFQLIKYIDILIREHNPKQSDSWNNNALNFIHATYIIFSASYNLLNGSSDQAFYFTLSCVFYLYDIQRHNRKSVFFWHHIISIFVICVMRTSSLISLGEKMFLSIEIGNISLYTVHAIKKHHNKSMWGPIGNNPSLLYFELVWYVFFRVVVFTYLLSKLRNPFYVSLGIIFLAGSSMWSFQIYKKIRGTNQKSSKKIK